MLLRVWEGGMSFHGGLLGVAIAMWLYGRKLGRGFFEMTDFVAPLAPLGLAFGRLGNFINGELWGKPTDVPWGFVVNGVTRHASQLYQAGLEGVVLFLILPVSATIAVTLVQPGGILAPYEAFLNSRFRRSSFSITGHTAM
jgi:phosphatidylglycerol:prolipoprotein diacylglycerol transferase